MLNFKSIIENSLVSGAFQINLKSNAIQILRTKMVFLFFSVTEIVFS